MRYSWLSCSCAPRRPFPAFWKKKLPPHIELAYGDLKVNVFTGFVGFTDLELTIKNRGTQSVHTTSSAKAVDIEGIAYHQFLLNNTIEIKNLRIDGPKLEYRPDLRVPRKDTVALGPVNLLKTVLIDRLALRQGEFSMIKSETDSIKVAVGAMDFAIWNVKTDSNLIKNKIPIEYGDYSLSLTDFFADLGRYETMEVHRFDMDTHEAMIRNLLLKPKFSKRELSKKLHKERDHMALEIPELHIKNIDYGFHGNRFYVSMDSTQIRKLDFEIYRDKLLPDDLRHKPLYGQLLKKLSIDIDMPQIQITDGHIGYEERVTAGKAAGRIFFDSLNMTIQNLGNYRTEAKKVQVIAQTRLMGESPLQLNWSFNANNSLFDASGTLRQFSGPSVNLFLVPNIRADAKGTIEELFFTIHGNSEQSRGHMKMKYRDFRFEVYRKKGPKVNKFLTKLGNLFINDGSKGDEQGYRYGQIQVDRIPNKSFFNYLWRNVEHGMISTMAGNGKQKG